MATDRERVRAYYAGGDEAGRLDTAEGKLELRGLLRALDAHLEPGARVLDLGAGPGRVALELARRGHRVVVADLVPELLELARSALVEAGMADAVESFDEVDAVDLARYGGGSFDAALSLGPFYHLGDPGERRRAADELARVVRPGGVVLAACIPRAGGIAGLVQRAADRPGEVTAEALRRAARTGVFASASAAGFQEGWYARPGELERLLEDAGLRHVETRSLRSILFGLGEAVQRLAPDVRAEAERVADELCRHPEVVGASGHALVVARRTG